MADPGRFLNVMAQALSAMSLYNEGHPARMRTASVAHDRLVHLLAEGKRCSFSFLDSEVIYGQESLRDLKGWEWGLRLAAIGVERLEFIGQVPREEFDAFLSEVFFRLSSGVTDEVRDRVMAFPSIKFGTIGVRGLGQQVLREDLPVAKSSYNLSEEMSTIRYIHAEIEGGKRLPIAEAEAVVASLAMVMHSDSEILLPLLQLKEYDQYIATHSLNVSVLAMALGEHRGLLPRDIRAMGVAGLMHDIGMTRVPKELLAKRDAPTAAEWELIRQHPAHGAQIILASEPQVDIAAVVAYEHHIMQNDTGYPRFQFPRAVHYATKLVQVCDRYDSLRTRRPFRDMWSPARALQYVEERAGTEFDAEMARAFCVMIRQWDGRVVDVDETTPVRPVPWPPAGASPEISPVSTARAGPGELPGLVLPGTGTEG